MDKKEPGNELVKNSFIPSEFQKKDWVRKLEELSGKPVQTNISRRFIYLLIDCSESMAEGNKIEQARKGAYGFAIEAQKDRYSVGLIKFSSYPEHLHGPLCNTDMLQKYLGTISTGGSTDMAAGLRMAMDRLSDKAGERVVCIITDGMPDDERATIDAAEDLKRHGIEIMAIGTDDANRDFLERLVTRKDLSVKVSREQLSQGIVSMARMLPGKKV